MERINQAVSTLDSVEIVEAIALASNPMAIIGGAGWSPGSGKTFARFAETCGLPVASAFRRQDAISNRSTVWAGNLGYGPNPKLVQRIKAADLLLILGPRLGEATTDGYTLITPDHPGQTLIHVHPDATEIGRVYDADTLSVCADVNSMVRGLDHAASEILPTGPIALGSTNGAKAHADYLAWSTPAPREGVTLDLGPCVAAMREAMPADTIICNGAGNYSGWWHRYWRYAGPGCQLAPTAGAMGYGLPAAVAASLRHPDRSVVALAGDGCFLMNGQELATAVQHDTTILVLVIDNGAYGTIRMHQEREFPSRVTATRLHNPDFAALARAYGCWAETVERTEDFAPALDRALAQPGVKLLHIKTDVETITAGTTLSAVRRK